MQKLTPLCVVEIKNNVISHTHQTFVIKIYTRRLKI